MQSTSAFPPPPAGRATARLRRLGHVTGLLLLAGLCACATSRWTRKKFLERVPPPQPILTGTADFGGGALVAQAWLGSSVRLRKPGERGDEERPGGGRPRHAWRGASGGEEGGSPFEDNAEDRDRYSGAEIDEMYGKVNYQYILPPRLALTLALTNHGTQPMVVDLTEVNSAMGNFAPRPETLMLAPGQEGRVDPMLSSFDNNFEELDVTVGMTIGGRAEQHVLHLRRVPEPSGAAAKP